nr:hypothetical protein E1E62_10805 [Staphylococcus aureus]
MAKEIINNTERFILVQIDKEGTERVVYQDFTGSFTTSEMVNHAQDFKSEENAKKIAETLRQRRYRTCSISRFHRKFYNF